MDKKQKSIELFQKWSETYDRFIFQFWMRYVQREALKEAKLTDKSRLLDVGCGTGYLLIKAREQSLKASLTGVDFSMEMLEKAKQKLKGKNAKLYQADILEFMEEKDFDVITTADAFHHFTEPEKSIMKMSSLLKKGGKLIVMDINFKPLFLFNLLWKLEPGFVKMYSGKKFRMMFEESHLKIVKQKRIFLAGLMTVGEKA